MPLLPDRMMQWLLLIAIPTNSLIHSFIQSFSVNSFIALHCTALHCIASPFYLFRAIYCACHKSAQSIPNAMPMDCWSGLLLPFLQSLFLSLFGPLFHSPELQPSAISCSFPHPHSRLAYNQTAQSASLSQVISSPLLYSLIKSVV